MNIAICDDNEIERREIAIKSGIILDELGEEHTLTEFVSGEDLLDSDAVYDVALLDMEMPGLNGLETAGVLHGRNSAIEIVFVTSHDELSRQAYKVRAFRYVLKSAMDEELKEAYSAIIEEKKKKFEIVLNDGEKNICMNMDEIYYIEALGDRTRVCIGSESMLFCRSLKYWDRLFGNRMYQCHKSFLVNFKNVRAVNSDAFFLKNGKSIPISARKKVESREKYIEYIKENARYY